ncbi:hypothetical protein BKA80DRAFT_283439 [Phyllosticta citrichinensis]
MLLDRFLIFWRALLSFRSSIVRFCAGIVVLVAVSAVYPHSISESTCIRSNTPPNTRHPPARACLSVRQAGRQVSALRLWSWLWLLAVTAAARRAGGTCLFLSLLLHSAMAFRLISSHLDGGSQRMFDQRRDAPASTCLPWARKVLRHPNTLRSGTGQSAT